MEAGTRSKYTSDIGGPGMLRVIEIYEKYQKLKLSFKSSYICISTAIMAIKPKFLCLGANVIV